MNRAEAITLARAAARQHGYALAVHGSLKRDVDLLAVPWIEGASGPRRLARAVAEAIGCGVDADHLARHIRESVLVQAHGRMSWAFYPAQTEAKDHGWYVDLSVMPRREA